MELLSAVFSNWKRWKYLRWFWVPIGNQKSRKVNISSNLCGFRNLYTCITILLFYCYVPAISLSYIIVLGCRICRDLIMYCTVRNNIFLFSFFQMLLKKIDPETFTVELENRCLAFWFPIVKLWRPFPRPTAETVIWHFSFRGR